MFQKLYKAYLEFQAIKKKHNRFTKYNLEESGSDNFRLIRDKLKKLGEYFTVSLLYIEDIEELVNKI